MQSKDIRWIQRFQNFSRAFNLLRSVFETRSTNELNQLEQEGAIRRYEYAWELAWKTTKDFLEYNGIEISQPIGSINVIKQAAQCFFEEANIEGDLFIEMLDMRNSLSHTYDFEKFKEALEKIENMYLAELEKLYDFFIIKRIQNE